MSESSNSIYPVNSGYILREKRTYKRFNKKAKMTLEHYRFLWILNVYKPKRGEKPKKRKVKVFMAYMPVSEAKKDCYIIIQPKLVKFDSLTKQLKYGYNIIDTNTQYNSTDQSVKRFYIKVGLV